MFRQHICCCCSFCPVVAFVLFFPFCFFQICEEGCNHSRRKRPVFTHLGLRQKPLEGQKNSKNVSLWFLKDLSGTTNTMALTEGGWTPTSIVEDDESGRKGICPPSGLPSTLLPSLKLSAAPLAQKSKGMHFAEVSAPPRMKKKRNLDRYGSGLNTPWDYHLRSSINKRRRCEGEGRSPSGLQHASNFCKMCERQIRPARSSLLTSVVLTSINEYLKK